MTNIYLPWGWWLRDHLVRYVESHHIDKYIYLNILGWIGDNRWLGDHLVCLQRPPWWLRPAGALTVTNPAPPTKLLYKRKNICLYLPALDHLASCNLLQQTLVDCSALPWPYMVAIFQLPSSKLADSLWLIQVPYVGPQPLHGNGGQCPVDIVHHCHCPLDIPELPSGHSSAAKQATFSWKSSDSPAAVNNWDDFLRAREMIQGVKKMGRKKRHRCM